MQCRVVCAMSYACGTLAHPEALPKGIKGHTKKQHTLPATFHHAHTSKEMIEAIWDPKSSKQPSRVWGTVKATKYGGETRPDGEAHTWTHGDLWNIDSNCRKWTEHEVRRNASSASHDIHRHDQIQRVVLEPQRGAKRTMGSRLCLSGVVSPDSCFLEAWGFDLGLRDRQAKPVGLFKPGGKAEQFRSLRSYDRDIPRIAENRRSLNRSISAPGMTLSDTVTTLRPEDIGGEADDPKERDHETAGKTHGTRSHPYWNCHDHCTKREGAKLSCSIHSPAFRDHKDAHPYVDGIELRPQAIYRKKFRDAETIQPGSGLRALRDREVRKAPMGT